MNITPPLKQRWLFRVMDNLSGVTVCAIAAIGKNTKAIGKDGGLLWSIPEDMKHFLNHTKNCPVIMGRKTWESIPKKHRPLPNRDNIVVTHNTSFSCNGAIITNSPKEALDKAVNLAEQKNHKEVFVIGGAEIYSALLPQTNRLYLTLIEPEKSGDTFFPDYTDFSNCIKKSDVREYKGLHYQFITLER
jgi:dihydrofolate reductase